MGKYFRREKRERILPNAMGRYRASHTHKKKKHYVISFVFSGCGRPEGRPNSITNLPKQIGKILHFMKKKEKTKERHNVVSFVFSASARCVVRTKSRMHLPGEMEIYSASEKEEKKNELHC
eukprot:TRINITY_DN4155_c0_g1_i3.p1 TRINITY_DN4155_c0_g1~~TRINITY_DN4155_c0_g1_i3.p1  ORF type:complete len:121 (-),score=3.11 TRINITY_DN4155_c0_g1_i3:418-780(-)